MSISSIASCFIIVASKGTQLRILTSYCDPLTIGSDKADVRTANNAKIDEFLHSLGWYLFLMEPSLTALLAVSASEWEARHSGAVHALCASPC